LKKSAPAPAIIPQTAQSIMQQQLWRLAGTNLNIIRFAGISGVSAVILGAFGAHRKFPDPDEKGRDPKQIFETGLYSLGYVTLPSIPYFVLSNSKSVSFLPHNRFVSRPSYPSTIYRK
jgi:hypothetical protein